MNRVIKTDAFNGGGGRRKAVADKGTCRGTYMTQQNETRTYNTAA